MNVNFERHPGVLGPPIPRFLVSFFKGFFFFQSDQPTQYQETHSTLNKKKKGGGLRRGENAVICLVKGLELYFNICRLLRIELQPGYLCRSLTKEGKNCFKALEPQAA